MRAGVDAKGLVVGVGAAAGGLEACEAFLAGLGKAPGVSVVVVYPLNEPARDRVQARLAKATPMKVALLEGRQPLESNTVYVATPRRLVHLERDLLIACDAGSDRESETQARMATAIDHLLFSLAEVYGERGVGVVLSGTGSDGTLGLKSVSDHGGLTFAQDAQSAKFDSMPRSAAATGVADHVLPPAQIAEEILRYVEHLGGGSQPPAAHSLADQIEGVLPTITETLRKVTDHNFQHYKLNTLIRRVLRRMHVLRISSAESYAEYVQGHEAEVQALFRELLIGVTAFFRDPEAFDVLQHEVLSRLIENRQPTETLRLWCAGCANGAEAYTLAILCRELMEARQAQFPVQIFATDIDQRALQVARNAIYPVGIEEHVTPARLSRFFVKQGKQYHVCKEIREMVLFSSHNLISDPPFSRLDMISCRNLLIYLGSHLQNKLIPLFHYALRPSGYLFLGPSESIAAHGELFQPLHLQHRISQRKATALGASNGHRAAYASHRGGATAERRADAVTDMTDIRQRIVLDEFAPKSCVSNASGQVLNAAADMHKYLSLADGDFHNHIVKMAASGLRLGLRAAIAEAKKTMRKVQHGDLSIQVEGLVQRVLLTVQPMPLLGEDEQLFLVVFQDTGLPLERGGGAAAADSHPLDVSESQALIQQMERELEATRVDLDRSLQEMEAANEELKSSNEELRSLNEELQSANEELETSKEEIRLSVEAVSRANSDLENLLRSTQIGTLFLDVEGNIVRFTPTSAEIYNLISADIGRPLSDITHHLVNMPPLPEMSQWKQSRAAIEHEVQTRSGRWYLRRVLPYLRNDQPDGMIISFIDVTEHKRAALRSTAEHQATKLLAGSDSVDAVVGKVLRLIRKSLDADVCGLWVVDVAGERLVCSEYSTRPGHPRFKRFAASSGRWRFGLGDGLPGRVWASREVEWIEDLEKDPAFLRTIASTAGLNSGIAMPVMVGRSVFGVIEVFSRRHMRRDRGVLMMLESISAEIGQSIHRKRLHAELLDEEARKTAILDSALDAIITMDMQGRIVDFNRAAERIFGFHEADVRGESLARVIIPPEYRAAHTEGLKRFLESGDGRILGQRMELSAMRADGSQFPIELSVNATQTAAGVPFFTAYVRDITQQQQARRELLDRERQLSLAMETGRMGSWQWDIASGRITWTDRMHEIFGYSQAAFPSTPDSFLEIVIPEDRPLVQRVVDAIVDTNSEREQMEVRCIRGSDAEVIWAEFCAVVERDSSGRPVRVTGFALETTDRKRRELALAFQASLQTSLTRTTQVAEIMQVVAQRLTEFLQLTRCLLVRIDEQGNTASVLHDYCPAALPSLVGEHTLRDFWTEVELQQFRSGQVIRINDTASPPRPPELVAQFRALHVGAIACAPATSDRQLRFLLCAIRDEAYHWREDELDLLREVSAAVFLRLERARAEQIVVEQAEKLAEGNRRLSLAVTAGEMAVWEWTPEKSVWEPSMFSLLDIPIDAAPSAELLFRSVHADDLPGLQAAWGQATQGGSDFFDHEFRIVRPDGQIRWLASVGDVFRDANGRVQRIHGLNWDITEQHEMQESLLQARAMAEAANASKSEFLANMSHEIRTPMTAILGYTDLIAEQSRDPEISEYIHTIKRNGQFLLEIINDILDLSKIEAGKFEIDKVRFSPASTIDDVRSIMEVRAQEKQLDLQFVFDGPIPEEIESDPKRLKQILINLVGNAIKFTQQGGVQVVVRYQPPEELSPAFLTRVGDMLVRSSYDYGSVIFEVIDSGIGMTEEHQQRLFRPFSQGDASITRSFGGTGLGLAISQRLAKMLGGEIAVRSVVNQGSRFTLTLGCGNIGGVPMVEPTLETTCVPSPPATHPLLECHVLVVDDRRDIRYLSQRFLSQAGARVSEAEDGQQGLEYLSQAQAAGEIIDLILLDMQMPKLDGYETARALRKMGFSGPIIALTADAMQGDMSRCIECGCNSYLSKPINREALLNMVQQSIIKSR